MKHDYRGEGGSGAGCTQYLALKGSVCAVLMWRERRLYQPVPSGRCPVHQTEPAVYSPPPPPPLLAAAQPRGRGLGPVRSGPAAAPRGRGAGRGERPERFKVPLPPRSLHLNARRRRPGPSIAAPGVGGPGPPGAAPRPPDSGPHAVPRGERGPAPEPQVTAGPRTAANPPPAAPGPAPGGGAGLFIAGAAAI